MPRKILERGGYPVGGIEAHLQQQIVKNKIRSPFGIGKKISNALRVLADFLPDSLVGTVGRASNLLGKVMPHAHDVMNHLNDKIFMIEIDDVRGDRAVEVDEESIRQKFPPGKQDEWPNLLICIKDARMSPVGSVEHLLGMPLFIEKVTGDAVDLMKDIEDDTKGKTLIITAFYTRSNMVKNLGSLLPRMEKIKEDPSSMEGLWPASKRIGDLLLGIATMKTEGGANILRQDAPEIFNNTTLEGFSQGGNIIADAFRYMAHELRNGNYRLARDKDGIETTDVSTNADIREILVGGLLLAFAPATIEFRPNELEWAPKRFRVFGESDMIISLLGSPVTNDHEQDTVLFTKGSATLDTAGHGGVGYYRAMAKDVKDELYSDLVAKFSKKSVAEDVEMAEDHATIIFHRAASAQDIEEIAQAIQSSEILGGLFPNDAQVKVENKKLTIPLIPEAIKDMPIDRLNKVISNAFDDSENSIIAPVAKVAMRKNAKDAIAKERRPFVERIFSGRSRRASRE